MYCPQCGKQLPERSAFCLRCGFAQPANPLAPAPSSPAQPVPAAREERPVNGEPSAKKSRKTFILGAAILLGSIALTILLSSLLVPKNEPAFIRSAPAAGSRPSAKPVPAGSPEPAKSAAAPIAAAPSAPLIPPTPAASPTPIAYPPPVFPYTDASSTTVEQPGRDYSADLVQDGDPSTAWNYTGRGGERITLSSDSEQRVRGIRLLNGYTKYSPGYHEWLYYYNNRPKNITVSFSDGTSMEWILEDVFDRDMDQYQDIPFPEPKLTTFIRITVDSVYRGSKWNDTCISEIQVY